MIIDTILNLGAGILAFLVGWIPEDPAFNGVIIEAGDSLGPIIAGMASLSAWIPFPVIAVCLGALIPVYLSAFLFRVARLILGHVPLIGGNG